MRVRLSIPVCAGALTAVLAAIPAHAQVLTSQYDNARTGANPEETILMLGARCASRYLRWPTARVRRRKRRSRRLRIVARRQVKKVSPHGFDQRFLCLKTRTCRRASTSGTMDWDCSQRSDERGAQLSQEYPPLADQLMGTKDRKAQCRNSGHLFQLLWSVRLVSLTAQAFHLRRGERSAGPEDLA